MNDPSSSADRIRSVLVVAATLGMIAFNALASSGRVNGVTAGEISAKYPTAVTPASYAFAIWGLIYAGLLVFSVLQALPGRVDRYRSIRSAYILSCALNCAWLFFWHSEQIAICLAIIVALLGTLIFIVAKARRLDSTADTWLVKAPFGIYLGWVCAATLVNFAVLLRTVELGLGLSEITVGTILVLVATILGVLARVKLTNYFAPLAVAWALTAIAVKQSGRTLIVSAAAVGVIACLIAALSFVMEMKGSRDEQR